MKSFKFAVVLLSLAVFQATAEKLGYENPTHPSGPQCQRPPDPDNGAAEPPASVQTVFEIREKLWYFCNIGYSLVGEKDIECGPSGEWVPSPPTCIKRLARCRPLAAPEGGIITTVIKNYYNPGDQVAFECRDPYELRGAERVVCLPSGQWSHDVPTCNPKRCQRPRRPQEGFFFPNSRAYDVDAVVTFRCKTGFNLDGAETLTCLSNGEWSDPEPDCIGVVCAPLDAPANGQLSPVKNSYNVRDRITFECIDGYVLNGLSGVVCEDTGFWSDPVPTCDEVTRCSPPDFDLTTGSFSPSQRYYAVGAFVSFFCIDFYFLRGAPRVMCQSDGRWSDEIPACFAITCPDLVEPADGSLSPEQFQYNVNDVVTFDCDDGFNRLGAEEVICQEDGKWSDREPICVEKVSCFVPIFDTDKGSFRPDKPSYDVNDVVFFSCIDGYVLDDDTPLVCEETGRWSAGFPICVEITCTPPQPEDFDLRFGSFSPNQPFYKIEERINFRCDLGYELLGLTQVICGRNGEWSADFPTCRRVSCDPLLAPENGDLAPSKTSYDVRDRITFTCDDGFSVVGAKRVVCLASGEWSDNVPICEEIPTCEVPTFNPQLGSFDPVQDIYNVNDFVTFTCFEGYFLEGSSLLTCEDGGVWSTRFPICKPVSCFPLVAPINGNLSPVQDQYGVDDEIEFECDEGFEINGAETVTCLSNGGWSDTEPTCDEEVTCFEPNFDLRFGFFTPAEGPYRINDFVDFVCNPGYLLVGESQLRCQENGRWSERFPECEEIRCSSVIFDVQFGSFTPNQDIYVVRDVVSFRCDGGYTLQGAQSVTCGNDGSWSAPFPTCEAVLCDPLTPPDKGDLFPTQDEYEVNSHITFSCDEGYVRVGARRVFCQDDGTWSDDVPLCSAVTCSPLTAPTNGRLSPDQDLYDVDQRIDFECEEGYLINGAETVFCQTSGRWTDEEPTCEAITCSKPDQPRFGSFSPRRGPFVYRTVVTFECRRGYLLRGAESVRCLVDGQWSDEFPTCEAPEPTCDPLPAPNNGDVGPIKDEYENGDRLTFTCDEGFILDGATKVRCNDGEWSDQVPTCVAVRCRRPDLGRLVGISPNNLFYDVNERVTYSCNPRYVLDGAEFAICQNNGQFSSPPPTCKRDVRCRRPYLAYNARASPDDVFFRPDDEITYSCTPGYRTSGASQAACQRNGLWSDPPPSCIASGTLSCAGRCHDRYDSTQICNCDRDCDRFNNCCEDYYDLCF
ncbi:unnamed protein product [Clavelina lepadiformis]|uniref:Sushi/von Willebrand factor type A/EGF/pentraxin domain-containing 1 n=1 Tax=Clavelina lepadiformis TaxID=159417 RepID=A0ABP0FXW1_CLALP